MELARIEYSLAIVAGVWVYLGGPKRLTAGWTVWAKGTLVAGIAVIQGTSFRRWTTSRMLPAESMIV
jgi:hypothetical protein